ncbi:hypothetical protein EV421DRAFT_1739885 [Armillaria borealis]|uniref:Uncharacterized protein n=1 Tax=Armillaria borealis TaxID=47425 RepID=A0AA39J739_9AGAR|nr:hypothetical protein EV421DRAFT_1739885 [Armillaria borealis]
MDTKSIIVDVTEVPSTHGTKSNIALDDMYSDESMDTVYQGEVPCAEQGNSRDRYGKVLEAAVYLRRFRLVCLATALILTQDYRRIQIQWPLPYFGRLQPMLDYWWVRLYGALDGQFNLTLLIAGVFGTAAGGSPNFVALACLLAVVGVGVGDLVPGTHQYLLTLINVWWSVGSLLGSLLAWPLIANYSCPEDALAFPAFSSAPERTLKQFLVIHKIAKYNGTTTTLTVEHLTEAAEKGGGFRHSHSPPYWTAACKGSLQHNENGHFYNTFGCALVLTTRGADFGDGSLYTTYRNQSILSVIGIGGSLVAGWTVEVSGIGRKGTLAISLGE